MISALTIVSFFIATVWIYTHFVHWMFIIEPPFTTDTHQDSANSISQN